MAEIVSSAIAGEVIGRIFSGITTRKDEDKWDQATGDDGQERLEMARIKMEAALATSNKWQITDVSLLHWRKKLKRAAQECENAAHKCKRLSLEQDKARKMLRKSSFSRRVAHATKAFVSSFVGCDDDHCSGSVSVAVRRFERFADGATEFMRFVELGGRPRQHLFFDPLIGHIFAGKTLMYQALHPRGQYHYFSIRPMGFEERGLEAILSFMYEDSKVPTNSFWLGAMLRLSESTNIIGTIVKCLRVMTPHFKSTTDVVIKEITQLPTQDFSYLAHKEHWNHADGTLSRWFRPDPLCCQGYEHDVVPSCHSSSKSGYKLRFSSIFPEPVCGVFLRRHISLSEYSSLSGSTVVAGHDDKPSLENSPSLKLGVLFLPHDSLEDPRSPSSAIEVIDRENQHDLANVNVHPNQLDEMLLPKAVDYLRHNAEATTYQICWRSSHGSAHLCVENTSAERMLGPCKATQEDKNIKSTLPQVQQEMQNWKQVTGAFLKLWVVRSSERLRSSFTAWFNELGQNH